MSSLAGSVPTSCSDKGKKKSNEGFLHKNINDFSFAYEMTYKNFKGYEMRETAQEGQKHLSHSVVTEH